MLWIWLLTRHSSKWSQPLERYFTFICARCYAQTAAVVRAYGYGTGRNIWQAQSAAAASAEGLAYRSVAAAACPCCGELSPNTMAAYELAKQRLKKQSTLRLPLTFGFGILVFILCAIPAIRDMKHSFALAVVAASASMAVTSFFFAIFSARKEPPQAIPANVWFSQNPAYGPASWFAAQPPRILPVLEQPSQNFRQLGFAGMTVTAIAAFIGLIVWSTTFRKVYVVNADRTHDIAVMIDGEAQGTVTTVSPALEDAPNRIFEVRTDATHTVVITDGKNQKQTYTLNPDATDHGWLIAPHSFESNMCLTTITWEYSTTKKYRNGDYGDKVLNDHNVDLIVMGSTYDFMFKQPPASIDTKQSSETRSSLRAVDCAGLEDDETIPYKDSAHYVPKVKAKPIDDPANNVYE